MFDFLYLLSPIPGGVRNSSEIKSMSDSARPREHPETLSIGLEALQTPPGHGSTAETLLEAVQTPPGRCSPPTWLSMGLEALQTPPGSQNASLAESVRYPPGERDSGTRSHAPKQIF